ncbi:SAM-dependent methyltransferase [Vibrio splendidus]|uniref:site-specific DNA-methyltransferase (adenine-specific) n=1 Tax=Vibrio splendidus TaxID=29497 RepID=A0A2T5EWZ8_VIBSP|nr:BREX-1 system adenine-specific DNA-methyltransferase PglX [Vibrio splendidus]PTP36319.1 SAM-dependent methyltransferase [Vibrio splendidus]
MNTNKLKAYAPKARIAFMEAVMKRAAVLGIYEDKISEATTQGTDTIIDGRVFTRKQGQQRQQLVNRLKALGGGKEGYNQFINEMAFTWFNRFTAIRFMEVNEYLDHGFRVLSKKADAEFGEGFEILSHATDVADDLGLEKSKVVEMVLAGNKEDQLYNELLLGQCHQLNTIMPFMFEKLDDATELLLPGNLTKSDSILKELINDIPEDNWQEIEVIGWLYQFYISEHKDAVMGKVVKKEDIPAATQLFTPNWIVKYLVQNSLGHQWLSTYPDSELKDKMEYYITPAEQSDEVIAQLKAITPTSIDPEEIRVLDPACGSGHILVEVYEVLREIYLERGYRLREIPELILAKNIYGLDIDDRAAQMAAFAVLMKAREDDKRIFSRDIKLNIHSIQSTENLNINQLWADLDLDGNKQSGSIGDLFAEPQFDFNEVSAENKVYFDLLRYLKGQFIDAKNLGSLIEVDSQHLESLTVLQEKLAVKAQGSEVTTREAAQTLLPIVEQAAILARQYDVVVANPPYLGAKGLNSGLKDYAKEKYPTSKFDLFSLFMERSFSLLQENGLNAMIVMESWMFLSSFEKFREQLLDNHTIMNLLHMPYSGRGRTSLGINFGTSAYVIANYSSKDYQAKYDNLHFDEIDSNGIPLTFPQESRVFTPLSVSKLKLIPSSPIVFWINDSIRNLFRKPKISDFFDVREGLGTRDDEKFLRRFWEVSKLKTSEIKNEKKWIRTDKSGPFRKWYGNADFIMNWENDGYEIKNFRNPDGSLKSRPQNTQYFFKNAVSWNKVGSGETAFRYRDSSWGFNDAAPSLFGDEQDLRNVHALLCSPLYKYLIKIQGGTLNVTTGVIKSLPYIQDIDLTSLSKEAHSIVKDDWDCQECSWDFKGIQLLSNPTNRVSFDYKAMRLKQNSSVSKLHDIENTINMMISNNLSLGEEIISEVKPERLTLFGNESYVFNNSDSYLREGLFKSYTISTFVSFAIGCAMGRFSLGREGLVYADSGNSGFKELVAEGAYKTFPADDDGIVPIASEEWLFEDDASTRFREFVKTVWGEEHLSENLEFVADSLCLDAIKPKKNESSMDTIRRYFSTQFYKDHLKTYKKRPIYWLFSSGKEKAFECLVYLHRYNESTLARMRTEYVTPLMGKMEAQHKLQSELEQSASSTVEKKRLQKEIKSIEKKQAELRTFDEELKHLAEMKISIDLDDGVKVNYGKFANLLHDVKGIHGKKPDPIK